MAKQSVQFIEKLKQSADSSIGVPHAGITQIEFNGSVSADESAPRAIYKLG